MSAEIINAFGRKDSDPPPDTETRPAICDSSMLLAKELLRMAETGKIRGLTFACIHEGSPMSGIVRPPDETIVSLSMLTVAADSLKEQLRECVRQWSRATEISQDDVEGDDD